MYPLTFWLMQYMLFLKVAGFVAALRMFFIYGITNRSQLVYPLASHNKEISSMSFKSNLGGSRKSESGPYRPPHLRKQDLTNMQQLKAQESPSFSDEESSKFDYMSSDSDYSDNDGPAKDADNIHCSKARVAAIVCIQVAQQHLISYTFILYVNDLEIWPN